MSVETKYLDLEDYAKDIDTIAQKYMQEAETTDMVAVYPKVIGGTVLDRGVKKKNDALRKKLVKKPIQEGAKAITVADIIASLGGEDFYRKTFKSFHAARTYTLNNLQKVMKTFQIQQKDLPLASLETKLKQLIGSK